MKYDKETTTLLTQKYNSGLTPLEIAAELNVPERSVIAKLASLGVYKRKEYTDKRGNKPVKKAEYVDLIADVLDVDLDLLESLEKVNKNVLKLLLDTLNKQQLELDTLCQKLSDSAEGTS